MPRRRMLWPAYFSSDQLARLSLAACRTFEGFWCYADDKGRMPYDPDQLWGDVWLKRRKVDHVTVEDVEGHLDLLVDNGQLCEYEVGGGRFLHCISWSEHQKINHPTPSKLPPCPHHEGREWASWWRSDDTATARWRAAEKAQKQAENGGSHVGLREASLKNGSQAETSPLPGETDSRSPHVVLPEDSRRTPSQCSSVQLSSVKAKGGGKVRQFVRPSQRQAGNQ